VRGIAKFVENPKRLVPSLVWAEAAKERQNIWGQIFADSPFDRVVESGDIIAKRKVGVFCPGHLVRDGSGVPRLIENSSQRKQSLKSKIVADCGNPLSELNFVRLVESIRVRLDKNFVRLTVIEPRQVPFEICDVFLCPSESTLGTVERIGARQRHERQNSRPHKRPRI
jgi:hypothetical protein